MYMFYEVTVNRSTVPSLNLSILTRLMLFHDLVRCKVGLE